MLPASRMEHQTQLFSAVTVHSAPSLPEAPGASVSLTIEIAALWGLPLDKSVQITLLDHTLTSTVGLLQLARLPDLPFHAHTPLALRIGSDRFTSNQIVAWSVMD